MDIPRSDFPRRLKEVKTQVRNRSLPYFAHHDVTGYIKEAEDLHREGYTTEAQERLGLVEEILSQVS